MSVNETTEITTLPLASLVSSPFQPAGREKPDDLGEMVLSIQQQGILQPIIVRPVPATVGAPGAWQIVAGHRRVAASRIAGFDRIPARCADFTDEEAREIQLVENLMRADLSPLHEALMLSRLLEEETLDVHDVALKIGKPPSYVRRRISLLRAPKAVHKLMDAGKVSAAAVELVLTIEDKSVIEKAWKEIEYAGRSLASMREFIRRKIHQYDLGSASWKLDDASMPMPYAAACSVCPYRVVPGHELFDVEDSFLGGSKAGTCSKPPCYETKVRTVSERKVADLSEQGFRPLKEAEVKKATKHGFFDGDGFVRLDERASADPKNRTWRQLLAAAKVAGDRMYHEKDGTVLELAPSDVARSALKELGIRAGGASATKPKDPQAKAEAEARAKRVGEKRLRDVVLGALTGANTSGVGAWAFVARRVLDASKHDQRRAVYEARARAANDLEALGRAKKKAKSGAPFSYGDALKKELLGMTDAQARVFAVQLLATSLYGPWGKETEDAVETFGVSMKDARAIVAASEAKKSAARPKASARKRLVKS